MGMGLTCAEDNTLPAPGKDGSGGRIMQQLPAYYSESLAGVNECAPLSEKFTTVLASLQRDHPYVSRLAAAIYDQSTDLLKSFVYAGAGNPLPWYQARLAGSRSLSELKLQRYPRIVNDLSVFGPKAGKHHSAILEQGYQASYTLPVWRAQRFVGFVFLNSDERDVFVGSALVHLDGIANLLARMVVEKIGEIEALLNVVRLVEDIAHLRDNETGQHLMRMAAYAHVIAFELAPSLGLTDEFVEYVRLFAPLHDVGKIGIPDEILLKRGPLSREEYELMKTHTTEGRKIVERMLHHFDVWESDYASMLLSIVVDHHEALDGSGYPAGKAGDEISLVARIIAVADVFDALTGYRPYKEPWDNQAALAELAVLAGSKLDPVCVDALSRNLPMIEAIQRTSGNEASLSAASFQAILSVR